MDAAYTKEYEAFELHHWWHRDRRRLIRDSITRFTADKPAVRWLDVGCGTGVLLAEHTSITDKLGLEMDAGSVARAQEKHLNVLQIDTSWDFSPHGTFDLISACDVIEHVEHDTDAVREVRSSLNPSGVFLVTVPALQSLWSAHDVRNHHFRRYNLGQLRALFPPGEWTIEWSSYFCSFLLPAIWTYRQFARLTQGTDPDKVTDDKNVGNPLIDAAFYRIFNAECRLVQKMPMPLGSSLILVATKA